MAEVAAALATVGAVSSILQIVEFSAKIVALTRELGSATVDGLKENLEIEKLTREYKSLSVSVSELDTGQKLGASDAAVERLAQECKIESGKLLQILEDLRLKTPHGGLRRFAEVTKQASRTVAKEKKIESKRKYLHELNNQLSVALLQNLRQAESSHFGEILERIEVEGRRHTAAILAAKTELLQAAARHDKYLRDSHDNNKAIADIATSVSTNHAELKSILLTAREQASAEAIVDSLRFPEVGTRRAKIDRAAHGTFRWIFDHPITPFTTWLQSNDDLFWLSGKAGSGKSTLMKFITEQPETEELLRAWAHPNSLCIVDVYFWYAGTTLQNSVEGLLRTLLWQILHTSPWLVSLALPRRWRASEHFHRRPDDWTESELSQALERIGKAPNLQTKYCIFIDGLDEFQGDRTRLSVRLRELAANPHIKICVSSRPWDEFCQAFNHLHNKFRLEDLTRPDIERYVANELDHDLKGRRDTSEAGDLINEIVAKAEGVFLWVYLVVRSVQNGLRYRDPIHTLRLRVRELPSDLDQYFALILSRVDEFHKKKTWPALKLATESTYEVTVTSDIATSFVDFWHLRQYDQSLGDPEHAFGLEPRICSRADMAEMIIDTQSFLSACTKDLLHVTWLSEYDGSDANPGGDQDHVEVEGDEIQLEGALHRYQVNFLHRTVYEFLTTPERLAEMDRNISDHFKHQDLMRYVALARLKIVPYGVEKLCESFRETANNAIFGADDLPFRERRLSEEVEKTALLYLGLYCGPNCSCMENGPDTYLPELLTNFASHHLPAYVETVLRWDSRYANSLLLTACGIDVYQDLAGVTTFPMAEANLDYVKMLLDLGADPNGPADHVSGVQHTLWHSFLTGWRDASRSEYSNDRESDILQGWRIAKLLIERGADLFAWITYETDEEDHWNRLWARDFILQIPLPESISSDVQDTVDPRATVSS